MKAEFRKGDMIFEVQVLDDDYLSALDSCEAIELQRNPLPIFACQHDERSPFDHTDFAIDNVHHNAYFTAPDHDAWSNGKRFFILKDRAKELQPAFSKMGYARHDAWLKAIECLKGQADFIRQFIAGNWRYVGITLSVTRTMTDKDGLVWSADISSPHCSIWGVEWSLVEWSLYSQRGYIDNGDQIRQILPDLLPDGVHLSDDDIQEIIYNLE